MTRTPIPRKDADIDVTDHAVLRWLERVHDLPVAAIRAHLAGEALSAAELGAMARTLGGVRICLRHNCASDEGTPLVTLATVTLSGSPRHVYRRRRG